MRVILGLAPLLGELSNEVRLRGYLLAVLSPAAAASLSVSEGAASLSAGALSAAASEDAASWLAALEAASASFTPLTVVAPLSCCAVLTAQANRCTP